ncbi:TonB-dependent receptor [Dyella subtropica]|uniref:TonB-dependent receptor n=1 Tax=Dyella subtropica TaxID=2992127 RepID=UPI0022549932|nr:TonB-dependent receptor [Dyella subtropica]
MPLNSSPHRPCMLALAIASSFATPAFAADPQQSTTLDAVQVHASDTHVTETPAVQIHVTREQLQKHNITDSSDALKYAPNIQVRKRYIGDPNAVISGRNAGTLQSARSLVYADGLLLSNLMTNGWDGAPRWGMVAPEEIGAVDVLYGPYSALYPGNSMGNTVLIHTRLPETFIASASAQFMSQDFSDRYGSSGRYNGRNIAATLGNKQGRWSWMLALNKLGNNGQPMQYATAKAGGDPHLTVPVQGATLDRNPNGTSRLIYGANTIEHTEQTQAKLKVGVDVTDHVAALFTLGWWHNHAEDRTRSLLRDAHGQPIYTGVIDAFGQTWALPASGLAPTSMRETHVLYGAELNGRLDNGWHWTAVASKYDFQHSQQHTASLTPPVADLGGPGTVADMGGSGWETLDLRSSGPISDQHMLYAGVHGDRYVLNSRVRNASDWRGDADGSQQSAFGGRTRTYAAYLEDVWSFAPAWALTLGGRWEQWRAYDGLRANTNTTLRYADRQRTDFSPKAALSWDFADDWQLRLASGKAVRYPTVNELFQGSISANAIVNNNPNLRPERDWSTDLTLIRHLANGHWRVSVFQDRIADSLYSQTDITVTPTVTNIQNVEKVRMRGVEGEITLTDVWTQGLNLQASVAFNNAKTLSNRQYPLANGRWFPRIPKARATLVADYRFTPNWNASLAVRHSGRQYGTLDNSDFVNTYGAVSRFTVADAKLRWKFAPQWTASIGVDNLTNEHYWAYHPYAGRTWFGEVRWDY